MRELLKQSTTMTGVTATLTGVLVMHMTGSWTEPATVKSYYNCRGKSKLINTVSKPESKQMTAIPGTGLSLNLNFKTPANLDCWDDSDESDWIMNDSGACTSVCPLDYATEYPLRTTDGTVPTLANCNGGTMKIHGRRTELQTG